MIIEMIVTYIRKNGELKGCTVHAALVERLTRNLGGTEAAAPVGSSFQLRKKCEAVGRCPLRGNSAVAAVPAESAYDSAFFAAAVQNVTDIFRCRCFAVGARYSDKSQPSVRPAEKRTAESAYRASRIFHTQITRHGDILLAHYEHRALCGSFGGFQVSVIILAVYADKYASRNNTFRVLGNKTNLTAAVNIGCRAELCFG